MKRQTTKQKKNQEHRNIATLSLQLRSYNKTPQMISKVEKE